MLCDFDQAYLEKFGKERKGHCYGCAFLQSLENQEEEQPEEDEDYF